ncbi:MAG: FAD-dependent oxidoreductase [Solirubrobacteraceae bacterium]
MNTIGKPHVLIAGGGVAAVEALLALADAAGDRVAISVLAPGDELEIRALAVAAPFAQGHEARRFPLAPLAERLGARLIEGTLAQVVAEDQRVITTQADRIDYDALIVAVGAMAVPAYENVMTFGREPLAVNGLLADIEEGYLERIAFVVPPGVAWPLPAYELALMTRRQATSMGMDPEITVVTPEASPLAVFGRSASLKVAALLEAAGVAVRTGSHAAIGADRRIVMAPSGDTLSPQRIVALPLIAGPRIAGLPHDQDGFVPVDEYMRVLDAADVYCVGDAANYPLKQGGLATQQADVAALHVAAKAGAPVTAKPFRPVLRGRLMTGGPEHFFVKEIGRPAGRTSETPLWWPPSKVSGRYLTPWLSEQDPGAVPPEPAAGESEAIEARVPSDPAGARRALLALSPLGDAPPLRR